MTLRRRLVKLLAHDPDVHLLGYSCFGQCDYGPNVAFYPPGEWFGSLSEGTDANRLVSHAHGSEPLARAPLRLPDAERELHLRNIEDLVRTHERDRARPRRWWWPF
jgi:(2Fe-2S) ferredoxin